MRVFILRSLLTCSPRWPPTATVHPLKRSTASSASCLSWCSCTFGHLMKLRKGAHRLPRSSGQWGDVLNFWQPLPFCAAAGFRRRVVHRTGSSGRRRVPPGKGGKAAAGSTGMCKCKPRRAWGPSLTLPYPPSPLLSPLAFFDASALHRYQPYEGCRCTHSLATLVAVLPSHCSGPSHACPS